MKNSEIAKSLLDLANVYGSTPDKTPLGDPGMTIFAETKNAAVLAIKSVGGKFLKRESYGGDSLIFDSKKIRGFSVWVPRDRICRKIPARYECEPLLSPEDEAEILSEEKA